MALDFTSVVEMELDGPGGGWTDVSADVLGDLGAGYGIDGSGPNDRTAGTGQGTVTLNNSARNSAGLAGYYSPGHANCRAGFDAGIKLRWRVPETDDGGFSSSGFEPTAFAVGTSARTFFIGKIDSIEPSPGSYRDRHTAVRVVDWIDTAASLTTNVALQLSKRTDQIAQAILDGMAEQPESTVFATCNSTFAYALDNVRDEKTRVLAALASLMHSEGGFGYVRGSGALVVEARLGRAAAESQFTLDDDMHGLSVEYSRGVLYNKVQVTTHPRRIDAAATTVLWSLNVENVSSAVQPGETVTFMGPYGDPLNNNDRCGGTDMVTPVATTDYTMNSQADGLGTDLTASFSVTPSGVVTTGIGANGVSWSVTNNAAVVGYITKLQIRGKGIYDTTPVVSTAEDAASIAAYGERLVQVDMPYQDDPAIGAGFAAFLLNLYKTPTARPTSVSFTCSDATLLNLALAWDIGTRFTLRETQTGVDTDAFIQRVSLRDQGGYLRVEWGLAPADMTSYWLLGTANASELGLTTRLGFA
jgi:hypothetical protein